MVYNKGVLTFALLSCVFVSFSQSIQIKSSEDLSPLPFASVLNISKMKLHFADEMGMVSGNFEIGDSIFITHVGYKNLKAQILHVDQTFLLHPSNVMLDTVSVVDCKHVVKHEYSNVVPDTSSIKFLGVCCWSTSAKNAKVAVLLKSDQKAARLNAFSIWVKKHWSAPKSSINAPIRFTFYDIDESTMLPGEVISNKQVIYYPKKEGKQIIKIDSLHVRFQEPGMYVSIEYLFDEKYVWTNRYIDTAKGIDSLVTQFGNFIEGVYSNDFSLVFYNYETDKWSFPGDINKPTPSKRRGTIKFSAQMSSCKEQNK